MQIYLSHLKHILYWNAPRKISHYRCHAVRVGLPLWFWGVCTCYWCHCALATCSEGEDSAVSESSDSLPYTKRSRTEGPPSDTGHSSPVERHTCIGALEIQTGQRSGWVRPIGRSKLTIIQGWVRPFATYFSSFFWVKQDQSSLVGGLFTLIHLQKWTKACPDCVRIPCRSCSLFPLFLFELYRSSPLRYFNIRFHNHSHF